MSKPLNESCLRALESDILAPTLSESEFADRFVALHKQLWCTEEALFDDVTTHAFTPPDGFYQVDHSFLHDGTQWHLYYCTGDLRLAEEWNRYRRAGDWTNANRVCALPGNGHAAGRSLFDLRFVENVFLPSQGAFDLGSRDVCSLFQHGNAYGMLYDARGEGGECMGLAWSDDLSRWTQVERNPILTPPSWSNRDGAFKDPHVMPWRGAFLIYVVCWETSGHPCVALFSTRDWVKFHDHGPIFRMTPALRGTFGIESPQVLCRDGLWHLFFTHGPGLWHAVAPSPTGFLEGNSGKATRVSRGAYLHSPFHATEMLQGKDGRWWLTTDRKEQTRRLNRGSGRMCYRGSYEDEKTLEEGLYVSEVTWEGDYPRLRKPVQS